jgi:hypothetical protein
MKNDRPFSRILTVACIRLQTTVRLRSRTFLLASHERETRTTLSNFVDDYRSTHHLPFGGLETPRFPHPIPCLMRLS